MSSGNGIDPVRQVAEMGTAVGRGEAGTIFLARHL
jgi:hypothetical protein